jgi:peroxiredoxin
MLSLLVSSPSNISRIATGMPGAFTPTCTQQHLPGYIQAYDKFKDLDYSTIAIITTNDRFVSEEWSKAVGKALNVEDSPLTILSDGDGDAIRTMGLADDMGFGLGVRSKRFAMALDDGVVTHLLTDEGMDDCSKTTAESLLKAIAPEPAVEDSMKMDGGVIAGVAAVGLALIVGLSSFSGDGGPVSSPVPAATPKVQSTPSKSKPATKAFSLLDEYMKN